MSTQLRIGINMNSSNFRINHLKIQIIIQCILKPKIIIKLKITFQIQYKNNLIQKYFLQLIIQNSLYKIIKINKITN